MTRRFRHNKPWSSLLDAWSEACPRLRHTTSVRDDRLGFQASRATRASNSAVASAACSEGPLLHLRVHRAPGIPHALCFQGGRFWQSPDVSRRGDVRQCLAVIELTGRANARPMTGSANQSSFLACLQLSSRRLMDCIAALAMTIGMMGCFAEPVIGRRFASMTGTGGRNHATLARAWAIKRLRSHAKVIGRGCRHCLNWLSLARTMAAMNRPALPGFIDLWGEEARAKYHERHGRISGDAGERACDRRLGADQAG
jgi:hypothetical protein